MFSFVNHKRVSRNALLSQSAVLGALSFCLIYGAPEAWCAGPGGNTSSTTSSTPSSAHVGVFDNAQNAINGSANGSNVTGVNTQVSTGANTNANTNQVLAPTQAVGGSSALVLPRNPLMLPNAGLGRSNFGLQFGVNNNPVFGNIFGKGAANALGWFMQGGVTIPFGKIPDIIANPRNAQMDDFRRQRLDEDRQVFGAVAPNARATVQGRIVSMNAYNYATAASPKVNGSLQDTLKDVEAKVDSTTPKVIALSNSDIFTRALHTGQKIAATVIGDEYRYVGHTSSGWLKLVLPDGRQGWCKGQFEYLKSDYTEIDGITSRNLKENTRQTMNTNTVNKRLLSLNGLPKSR